MAAIAKLSYSLQVSNSSGLALSRRPEPVSWPAGAGLNGNRQTLLLPVGVNFAVPVPPTARMMCLILPSDSMEIVLLGNQNDIGVTLQTNDGGQGIDCIIPLGRPPGPVFLFNGCLTPEKVEVIFL